MNWFAVSLFERTTLRMLRNGGLSPAKDNGGTLTLWMKQSLIRLLGIRRIAFQSETLDKHFPFREPTEGRLEVVKNAMMPEVVLCV